GPNGLENSNSPRDQMVSIESHPPDAPNIAPVFGVVYDLRHRNCFYFVPIVDDGTEASTTMAFVPNNDSSQTSLPFHKYVKEKNSCCNQSSSEWEIRYFLKNSK